MALPVTARRGKLAKSTPSMLSNIVPIRVAVEPGTTVRDTITAVGDTLRGAVIHQRGRFEDLNAHSGYRGPSVNILPVLDNISFGPARGTMNILSTGPIDDLSIIVHGLDAGTTASPRNLGPESSSKPTPPSTAPRSWRSTWTGSSGSSPMWPPAPIPASPPCQ